MKKYIALAGVIALTLGVNSNYNSYLPNETKLDYILQGATKATILNDVSSVGGVVVHEYSVIDAVSVKLSNSQLAEIKKRNPMLRSFRDQDVNVSSVIESFSSGNVSFNVKKGTITWEGINSSNDPVVINSVDLNMPGANKEIKYVKLNGNTVGGKQTPFNSSIKLSADDQIELAAGQSVQVEVKFKKLNTTNVSEYQIAFGEIRPEAGSESGGSQNTAYLGNAGAEIIFHADTNEVSWTIANSKDYAQELSKIRLHYPVGNNGINSLLVNDIEMDFTINSADKLKLNNPITINNSQDINIRIAFEALSATNNEAYEIALQYTDGETQNVIVPATSYALGNDRDTNYPSLVRANLAHEMGITGYGVTVAIIDTGIRDLSQIKTTATDGSRDITVVDVLGSSKNKGKSRKNDENGHGTHLASIITNSSQRMDQDGNLLGGYNGIAPDVNLVVLKAFDVEGQSSYLDILNAIEYVVEYKDVLNIKVLNLSFSAIPSSYYWDDPLNQALMKAWNAGITVVTAAGNKGPGAMTIGVPGNTPYVITVGAVSDNYTPNNLNDDFVTTFSSAGPTYEGFIKPEVVAPGGHIQGIMDKTTIIRKAHPVFEHKNAVEDVEPDTEEGHNYFEMSGSSQSTAITTGIVALMLQANPNLSPDDIKCRLIETAKVATTETGELAFSVFQQGAGLVDAMAAIESTASGCSNAGLSIVKDLSGEEHFIGPARRHENDGDYYIPGVEGLEWSGVYSDSQLWRNNSFNADSQLWRNNSFNADSQLWKHTSFMSNSQLWRNNSFSADSQLWRNNSFDADSQLWRNNSFNADSQLWRNNSFYSDSLTRDWVNHE